MKEKELKVKLPYKEYRHLVDILKIEHYPIFIRDQYYTSSFFDCIKNDTTVRIRFYGDQKYFTYKTPRVNRTDKLIVRDEFEINISDANALEVFFEALNFHICAISEKYRTLLYSEYFGEIKIMIDKYPFIGYYMEIEGEEKDIFHFIKQYNLSDLEIETKNNSESFIEFCGKNNLLYERPALHFTFKEEELWKHSHKKSTGE